MLTAFIWSTRPGRVRLFGCEGSVDVREGDILLGYETPTAIVFVDFKDRRPRRWVS